MTKRREVKKNKPKPRLKKGQLVVTSLKKRGRVIRYDEWEVSEIQNSNVWLKAGRKELEYDGPFDAVTGKYKGSDLGMGFTKKIVFRPPKFGIRIPRA